MVRVAPYMIIALALAACGGSAGNGDSGASGFADTVYSPSEAAFTILSDVSSGGRLIVPDTTGGYGFALPLYVGDGKAPDGVCSIGAPAQRIVCMSSTHVAMLSALGLTDRIVGVSGLRYISDPEIQRRQPADIGPGENVDYELLLSLEPDLVMLYGIGAPSPMEPKLRELGIPYIYLNEFIEQSPLGKAEWLVAVAEICGKGDEGRRIFHDIVTRYEQIRLDVPDSIERPKVMLNMPYQGSWFMPASRSYMIRLVEDAGGSYVYRNSNTSSTPVDMEEAYMLASQADVWLNVDAVSSVQELKRVLPRFADIPSVRSGSVWASNKRSTPGGGNDFYESGVVYPDRVLSDLHAIFTGKGTDSTYYYVELDR
ncbi:MAG: ABC transporter substrate-binding protein [Muribaculaceae bacterium]|nr:ABC transporter substrate-binding protein [Muribaculaceae bacterium]